MNFGDALGVYLEALTWMGELMSRVPDSSFRCPTPCADFDVRSLSGHVVGTAERSLGTAERRSTHEIPHVITDVPDAMLAQRFQELAQQLSAAWSVLDPSELVTAPWGQCSTVDAVRGFTIETLVHGWDLAVATSQPSEAPAGLVDAVRNHVDQVIPEATRRRMYAPAGPSTGGAGPTERLANALGRSSRR